MDRSVEYGRIYSEICNGFSKKLIENQYIYFKHPTIAEHYSTYGNYDLHLEDGKKKGLYTEAEKLQQAIEGGWWTSEKESNYNLLKKTIENLNKTKNKLLLPSQKDQITIEIKKNEAILLTYVKERNEITTYTLEQYCQNKLTEDLLIFFTYKNSTFTEPFFSSKSDYYDLSTNYINDIQEAFFNYSNIFSVNNIKRIAASSFFQNLVYLNNDAYSFWGKPAYICTKHQIDVLLLGKMYRNMITNRAENGKPIDDEILGDPDKLVEYVDSQNNDTKFGKQKSGKGGKNAVSSFVGATKQDLDKLGVRVEKLKGKSLLQLAEEKGGVLEKNDYLNARENL